jgi:arabinoxylan arabinofuranohydrolase
MTGFTHKGTVLPNPPENMGNNNHASMWSTKINGTFSITTADVSNEVYARSVNVDILTYNTDGTMKQSTCTVNGPAQIKNLNPYDTIQAETMNKQKGIKTDVCSEGGIMLTGISEGDYTNISGVDFGDGAEPLK